MRIVLDTNVLIASFATQGICHELFGICLDQYQICLSKFILDELAEKLESKLKMPRGRIQAIQTFLATHVEMVKHGKLSKRVCRDPNDDAILALAQAADAEYLITGDEDLLILKSFGQARIVSPRAFWESLRN
ncbi:MAG: putative toxin-antitoxin system toxin component, PIN family [Spirochaetia bacterium]